MLLTAQMEDTCHNFEQDKHQLMADARWEQSALQQTDIC
jgi:hypothetical protein